MSPSICCISRSRKAPQADEHRCNCTHRGMHISGMRATPQLPIRSFAELCSVPAEGWQVIKCGQEKENNRAELQSPFLKQSRTQSTFLLQHWEGIMIKIHILLTDCSSAPFRFNPSATEQRCRTAAGCDFCHSPVLKMVKPHFVQG